MNLREKVALWRRQGYGEHDVMKKLYCEMVVEQIDIDMRCFNRNITLEKIFKRHISKDWLTRQIMAGTSKTKRDAEWVLNYYKRRCELTGQGTVDLWARYWHEHRYSILGGQISKQRIAFVRECLKWEEDEK